MVVEQSIVRGYSAVMLSRRFLMVCALFSCCAAPALAQFPKRLERCLPNPTLAQKIQDMQVPKAKVYVRIVQVEFEPDSKIPKEIQDEISKNETGITHGADADSDYLKDIAKEIAEVGVRVPIQDAGYFRVLTDAKLTALKTKGQDIDVVADVSADPGDQYRLGSIDFKPADPNQTFSYSPDSLRELIPLKRGELFNVDAIRKGLRDMTSMFGDEGYIDFTADPEFAINEETKIINLTFRLDPQRQYRIREIEFWGVKPEFEQRLRASYQQSGEFFSWSRLEQFFQENRAVLPNDVRSDEVISFHRDIHAGMIGILFDFRTCAGIENSAAPIS